MFFGSLIWRLERLECSNGQGEATATRTGSELRCWPARGLHSKASWDSGRSCSVLWCFLQEGHSIRHSCVAACKLSLMIKGHRLHYAKPQYVMRLLWKICMNKSTQHISELTRHSCAKICNNSRSDRACGRRSKSWWHCAPCYSHQNSYEIDGHYPIIPIHLVFIGYL